MNQKPDPKAGTSIIRPWVLILLVAVIIAAAVYWWATKNANAKPASTPSATPSITKSVIPSASPVAADYTNNAFGFSFDYPNSWGACKVREVKLDGSEMTYYINCPTKDTNFAAGDSINLPGYYSPLAISVYTSAQWNSLQQSEGPHDTLLKQTANYYFGWSQANGQLPSDWTEAQFNDHQPLLDSFKTF